MFIINVSQKEWMYAESFFQDPKNSHLNKLMVVEHIGKVRYSFIKTDDGQIFALNRKKYLGTGGFAKVKVVEAKSGANYVVKIIGDTGIIRDRALFLKEKEIDEILGYQVGFAERPLAPRFFLEKHIVGKQYHFKTLFEGVDLFESIASENHFRRKACGPLECIELAIGMLNAIQALHEKGYISLDVKFENFIVNFNGPNGDIIVHEIDHGFARKSTEISLKEPSGTRHYVAPEIVFDNICSEKSDTYSLGVLFLGGKLWVSEWGRLEQGIFNGLYPQTARYFHSKVGHFVFDDTMVLLSKMRDRKPDARPELLTIIAQLKELYNAVHVDLGDKARPSKFAPVPPAAVDAGLVVEDIIAPLAARSVSSPPLLYRVRRESSLQAIVPDSVYKAEGCSI